jgi:MYXO-CTERM domain-containing protein
MAFQVSFIPAPGVLALLGMAGLARRRQRRN